MAKAKKKAASRKQSRKAAPARKTVSPIPKDYSRLCPYLAIRGAAKAIDLYKNLFGARERMRMPGPDGRIGHAELQIGDSTVMLADEAPQMDFLGPQSRGGTTVTLHVYVKDCDATVASAVAAGAKVRRPPKDEFYGDRNATIEDPFGHVWHVAMRKENLSKKDLERRAAEAMKQK
jgi:PhnB protein